MKLITRSFRMVCALCATTFLLPQIVRAQPNDTAPKAANPPAVDAQADAQKAADAALKEALDKLKNMTVEEMRDYTRTMQEEFLRSQLSRQGFNDLEMQEIVIDFLHQQDAARQNVRSAAAQLRDALTKPDTTANLQTPPEQLTNLLAELQKAAADEQVRREQASVVLAQTLKLDERPRLDATLRLRAIIGDEIWYFGDAFSGMSGLATLPLPAQQKKLSAADFDKAATMGAEMGKKFAAMTPAQTRDYLREIQETALRKILTDNNFAEEKTQNAILDFVRAQTAARGEIRLVAARLRDAAANTDADDWKLLQLMTSLQSAQDTERARREAATEELRETLNLDANPRLNALLHLYGLIGDEAWSFADALISGSAVAVLPTTAEIKAKAGVN